MPNAKHIAEPWTLSYDGQIDGNGGKEFVCAFQWDSFKEFNDNPKLKATARLIKHGPELLKVAKGYIEAMELVAPCGTFAHHDPKTCRLCSTKLLVSHIEEE